MLVHRHPHFELAHVTARSEAGRASTTSTRARASRSSSSRGTPTCQGDVDAALVCWPHRVAAPAVAALRERGVRVVDLSADFRLRDRGIYEDWYGEHGAPELFGRGGLRPAGAAPRGDRAAPTSSPTRAATRPPRCSRSRRWRAPGCSATWSSTPSRACRAPAASRRRRRTSSPPTRTSTPTRSTATATRRRSSRSSPRRRAGDVTFTPHLRAARPGRARLLLRDPAREPSDDEVLDALRRRLRRRAVRRARRLGPPGVLDVRDTNFCRISVHADPRTGRILVFAAIDNLWKGAASQAVQNLNLMFGRRRARGTAVSFSSRWVEPPPHVTELPGGLARASAPPARRRASSRPAAPTSGCSSPTRRTR